jgi:hypothetical protein
MRSIKIKRATAIVAFPDDSDVRVVLEEPEMAEYHQWRATMQEYTTTLPAIHPITNEPIRNAVGQLESITTPPRVPISKLYEYLEQHVVSIVGIKEDDAAKSDILTAFFTRAWNFKRTEDVEENGKKTPREVTKNFGLFLLDKVNAEDTFTHPDPLESSSGSPQTSA